MAAGSKIAVEITGNSSDLQAALDKAADALKTLAGTVAKTAEASISSGDDIVKSNQRVGASFTEVSDAAKKASTSTAGSFSYQTDSVLGGTDKQLAALDKLDEALTAMAAAADRNAAAVVAASDRMIASNEELATSMKSTADVSEASAAKVDGAAAVSSAGLVKLGKTSTVAVAAIAAGSIYAAAKFQTATTQFVTQAGVSEKASQQLAKGILSMAAAVGQTPDQLAGGMYHIVSSLNNLIPPTQRVSTELGILKVAAEGAAVGNSNMTQTTYVLSALMNALGQTTVPQAKQSMAELNAIVGAGDMHMQDLVNAMSTGIVPTAKTFGVSLQSMGAALDVLADKGVPAQQAATKLRMALTEMGAPTKMAAGILETMGLSATQAISSSEQMTAALEKAGVSTTQIAQDLSKPDGILVALEDLRTHLEDSGLSATGAAAVISRAFGGIRGATVIETLYQSLDKLQSKYQQIGTTTAQFNKDWGQTQDTLTFQLHQTEAGVDAIGVQLGTWLIPKVETAIAAIRSFIDWLGQNKEVADALGAAIGVVLGGAVTAFAYTKAVAFVTALRNIASYMTAGLIPAVKTGATEIAAVGAAADTAAIGIKGMLGPMGLLVAAAIALKGPINDLSNALGKLSGGALGNSFTSSVAKGSMTMAQAVAAAKGLAAKSGGLITEQQALAEIKASGAIQAATPAGAVTSPAAGQVIANAGSGTFANPTTFATSLLKALGIKPTATAIQGITDWAAAEGPWGSVGKYNPLDITLPEGQATLPVFNSDNVQNFKYAGGGLQALVNFLQSRTPGIVQALKSGASPAQLEAAVNATGWAGSGGYSGTWGGTPATSGGVAVQAPVTPTATAPTASMHFNWQTGRYQMMTSAQYKTLQTAWLHNPLSMGGTVAMPTSPSALQKAQTSIADIPNVIGTSVGGVGSDAVTGLIKSEASQITSGAAITGQPASFFKNALTQLQKLITTARQTANQTLVTGLTKDMQTVTKDWSSALEAQMKIPASGTTLQEQLKVNLENLGISPTAKMTVTKKGGVSFGKTTADPQAAITAATDPAYLKSQLNAYTTYIKGLTGEQSSLQSTLKTATKDKDKALEDSTKTELATLKNTLLQAKVNYTGLQQQYQDALYTAFTTGIQNLVTNLDTRAGNLGTLYGAGNSLVNAGFNVPGQTLAGGTAAQTLLYAGLSGNALNGALAGIIPELEAGGGSISNSRAGYWASIFGGNNSELGTELGAEASGQLSATDAQTMWTSIDNLISTIGGLQTALQANTEQLLQTTNALLQQQNTQLSEKLALNTAQTNVLAGFIPSLPHFASGGPVLDDGLAFLHAGEHVVPKSGTLVSNGSPATEVHVHNHITGSVAPLLQTIDSRVAHPDNVYRVSQQIGRRSNALAGAPGGVRR